MTARAEHAACGIPVVGAGADAGHDFGRHAFRP
jgi:hypothetical protein